MGEFRESGDFLGYVQEELMTLEGDVGGKKGTAKTY